MKLKLNNIHNTVTYLYLIYICMITIYINSVENVCLINIGTMVLVIDQVFIYY